MTDASIEPPKPTGKPPEAVTLSGMLIPWNGPSPALLSMPGTDARYIPCFGAVESLRAFMTETDCPYTNVKQIDDGDEFLSDLPENVGGAPLHVILNPRLTPEGKVRYTQVQRDPEAVKKAELLALAARMRAVSSKTYDLFFRAGMGGEVHAFIEFCGVLSKYVDICERCAEQGIDFRFLNTHSGRDLPVFPHDMEYLGEKLDCIFGPAIRTNAEVRDTLRRELFGVESSPDAAGEAIRETADP